MNFQFNDTFYGHDINVFPAPQLPRTYRRTLRWLGQNWDRMLGALATILTIVAVIGERMG